MNVLSGFLAFAKRSSLSLIANFQQPSRRIKLEENFFKSVSARFLRLIVKPSELWLAQTME